MTDDEKPERPCDGKPAGYEIGRGKTPIARRFSKGRSGNPSGKRKERGIELPAMNEEAMKKILIEEAYRMIKVNDGDRQVSVPMVRAILRSLAVSAAKGQLHAQALFVRLLGTFEQQNKALSDEWLNGAINYKAEWEKELLRRQRMGLKLPEPVPHPDDVIIDRIAGTVRIAGPDDQVDADREGQDVLDKMIELRDREGGRPR
jgi:Family of unknown function (DUF5681)